MSAAPLVARLLEARVACLTAPAGFGKTALLQEAARQLGEPITWHRLGEIGPDGLPALLQGHGAGLLVLDDLHLLAGSAEACRALDRFLAAPPAGLRIWMAGRFGVPLASLARLKLTAQLVELGPQELAPDGWPAALELRSSPAWDAYIAHEVLGHLSPDDLAFAVAIAPLEQWTPEGCDWLLERTEGASALARLERLLPGLTAPAPALREWLLGRLRAQGVRYSALMRRAALWESQQGRPESAVSHALAAGDAGLILPLLRTLCERALSGGRLEDTERWLALAPAPVLEALPDLLLRAGEALRRAGRPRRAVRWLQAATVGFAAGGQEAGLLRAFCRLTLLHADLGEWEEARAAVQQVEAELPPAGRERAEPLLTLAEYAAMKGRLARAEEGFQEAAALFESAGDPEGIGAALVGLGARVYVAQGRLDEAAESLRRAQDHLAGASACDALLAEAQVCLLLNRFEQAERKLHAVLPHSSSQRAQLGWARAFLAAERGELAEAERLCQEAESHVEAADQTPGLEAAALAARGRVEARRSGELQRVRQAFELAGFAAAPLVREAARSLLESREARPVRTPVRVQCFGPLRLFVGEQEIPSTIWGRAQARLLFQYLLFQPGRAATRDSLLAAFWPDEAPDQSRARLRVTLNRLRRALAELGLSLETSAGQVRLPPAPFQVDLEEFREHLAAARAALQPEVRIEHCRRGRALFAGEPLADAFWPDADMHRHRAHRELADLLQLWHEAGLQLGRTDEAIAVLEELADLEPGREETVRSLMALLLRTGRQGEAVRRYRSLERWLKEELGLAPSPETRSVWRTVYS